MSTISRPLPNSNLRMSRARLERFGTTVATHAILLGYTAFALFPIFLTVINSFKTQKNMFKLPYSIPFGDLFSTAGYETVFNPNRTNAPLYLWNSLVVTGVSILFVIIAGSMAAHALSEYNFKGNKLMALYLSIGIMIPIRLGTVSLVRLCISLGLVGTLQGLILIYTAQNLPLAIFILTQFMRELPSELKDAARVDGASEYRIFIQLILPLIRPALASVAVFSMIPTWNDLWWPLIMASQEQTKTVTLGVQQFTGQFGNNWPALLAALTLAMLPVLIIYTISSKQLIRGLTAGAVKQ